MGTSAVGTFRIVFAKASVRKQWVNIPVLVVKSETYRW